MILDFLLGLLSTVVGWVNDLAPSFTVPSWLATNPLSTSTAVTIGHWLGSFDDFVPVRFLVSLLPALFVCILARLAFAVFMWVWEHLPTLWGFGTQ